MKKILVISTVLFLSTFMHAQVTIIAHRGASYLAPENTLASAKLAWELNADGVEVDIYLSNDNKIMVIHDSHTRRVSDQDYKIRETRAKILRTVDVGSYKDIKYKGEKIPFLKEEMKLIPPGKELVIEIKCKSEIIPYLKKVLKKYEKDKKYQFICFDLQTILDTKKAFPDHACYWLCNNTESLMKNINIIAESNLEGVSLKHTIIDEGVMKLAQSFNLEVWTWTVNDVKEAKRLVNLGVKGITTDRPGWLRENLF